MHQRSLGLCRKIMTLQLNKWAIYLKIINTSQGYIQKYEDLKKKLYICTANKYFNLKLVLVYLYTFSERHLTFWRLLASFLGPRDPIILNITHE